MQIIKLVDIYGLAILIVANKLELKSFYFLKFKLNFFFLFNIYKRREEEKKFICIKLIKKIMFTIK